MDTESFAVYVKIENNYANISKETRFYISNYKIERPLLKDKNKKVIGLMRDKFTGKITKDLNSVYIMYTWCNFVYIMLIFCVFKWPYCIH